MGYEKDDGVIKGVISNDGSSGDNRLGIGMAVVPGRGAEKGSGEAIDKSSKYCTSDGGPTSQSSSRQKEKRSSSILEAGPSPRLVR